MGLESVSYLDDLVITNPQAGDARSEGDDHLRNIKTALKAVLPGLAGRAFRMQAKSAGYTFVATDNLSVINCTAALTLTGTAAAILGNGFTMLVWANGGDVIIDPNGAETVNGAATVTVSDGSMALLVCNGTLFVCAFLLLAS